jgi:hypothetical protein
MTTLSNTMRAQFRRLPIAAMAVAIALASPAQAQNDQMAQIATPAQPDAIDLGTGALPGAKAHEAWHSQYGSQFARNVTVATLTPFLPDPAKATGTAVIVAPGGGFTTLSMQNEGWDVAKALAARGVAAFVLKYRLNQTPADIAAYQQIERTRFSGGATPPAPDAHEFRAADRRCARCLCPCAQAGGRMACRSRARGHGRFFGGGDADPGHHA